MVGTEVQRGGDGGLHLGGAAGQLLGGDGAGGGRLFQPLAGHGQHQLDAVFLVDPGGAGVIVHGGDVRLGVAGADLVDHALAHNVVGQAAERLGAHNVAIAALHQLNHLGGEQPALPHLGAQRNDAAGLFHQFPEGAWGIEPVFAHGVVHGAADGIQPAQQLVCAAGHQMVAAVELDVQRHIGDAVFHKAHQAGQVHLAVLAFQELFQVVVAQRRIFDVDFSHHADLDLGNPGDGHRGVGGADHRELALHVVGVVVDAGVHPPLNDADPLFGQGVCGAGVVLIGFCLAAQRNQQVAVKDAGNHLAQQRQGQGQAAVLFQTRKIQRRNGDIAVACLDQRLAQQLDVIGCAAAAARLGDEQRRMVQVILAGVEGVDKLADDQQRRVAGVVMDIFEAQLGHLAAAVAQNLHMIPLAFQRGLHQPELGHGHVGDQDRVGFDHVLGKIGGHIFHSSLPHKQG